MTKFRSKNYLLNLNLYSSIKDYNKNLLYDNFDIVKIFFYFFKSKKKTDFCYLNY